jgi:hypothetical protein
LVRVNNDNDRLEERLAAVEVQQNALAHSRRSQPAAHVERPSLKVVRLGPEEEMAPATDAPAAVQSPVTPNAAAAATSEERPMIKGSGDKVYRTDGAVSDARGAR